MRSIADDLRVESAQFVGRLNAAERISLALRLGNDDVALYAAAHGVTEHEALAALRRARAVGRVPSLSNDSDRS